MGSRRTNLQRGTTLIETMIAVLIAVIAVLNIGFLVFQTTSVSKNQGTETTRAVIYAQDKIERLLSLASVPTNAGQADWATCTNSAATNFAANCDTTGVAGSGWKTGLIAGGGIPAPPIVQTSCPTAAPYLGYMDFLDPTGAQIDYCANPNLIVAYVRMWQISDLTSSTSSGTLQAYAGGPPAKQVTLAVYALAAVSGNGGKPMVTLTSVISNPN